MKPRQSHECEFSSMCETTFGKEIKPSAKVWNLYLGMVLMDALQNAGVWGRVCKNAGLDGLKPHFKKHGLKKK